MIVALSLLSYQSASNLEEKIHLLFFYQAEDGIRDTSVTGVQTCALPISFRRLAQGSGIRAEPAALQGRTDSPCPQELRLRLLARACALGAHGLWLSQRDRAEIGRESCRERV